MRSNIAHTALVDFAGGDDRFRTHRKKAEKSLANEEIVACTLDDTGTGKSYVGRGQIYVVAYETLRVVEDCAFALKEKGGPGTIDVYGSVSWRHAVAPM